MSDENTRPQWKHQLPISIAQFVRCNRIVKITHHWKMTGVDTAENWIELHAEGGGICDNAAPWFGRGLDFTPNHHNSLVQLNPFQGYEKNLEAIEAWDKKHARERREYERLRKKFEGA